MDAKSWVILTLYTLVLLLPILWLMDRNFTVYYSVSKDVRIVLSNEHFHLERRMFLFRRWTRLTNIPPTTRGDKIFDIYNKIQKGEWGKKLVVNTREL